MAMRELAAPGPSGRVAASEGIAAFVAFLRGDGAALVTGVAPPSTAAPPRVGGMY
jgi:hypothetical protein